MGTFLNEQVFKRSPCQVSKYFSVILRAFGSRNLTVKEPDAGKGPHSWKFVLQSTILWLLSCWPLNVVKLLNKHSPWLTTHVREA